MARWKQVRLPSNDTEKPIEALQKGAFIICLNLNKGGSGPGVVDRHGHRWWYEVTEQIYGHGKERYVGEAPTEEKAKQLAKKS